MRSLSYYIKNPYMFIYGCMTKVSPIIPAKLYIKIAFKARVGYRPDLKNPKSFNEKLQWLKLYDRNPKYTELVDKYLVKDIIAKRIGEEYIIPTLGVWDKFDDIDFDKLPNKFVLKCNHDSGSVIICKDKKNFNRKLAKKKLEKSLKTKFYDLGKERSYKNVKPKIIAEKYMVDKNKGELKDYKFMCFNGKVKCSFVCSERFNGGLKVTFFDRDWNIMPFERHYPKSMKYIEKQKNYEEMIEIAEILSEDIPFVRIDLYEINGKIYFGEFTLYPGSGFEEFNPKKWDYKLGEWVNLSGKIK